MLYVKVPKEIKEYEEKILFGLSIRNIVWGLLALICGFLVFFPARLLLGQSAAGYVVMAVVIPCFSCGFLKVQGMSFDKYIGIMFRYYTRRQKLVYENTDTWIDDFEERKEKENVSKKEKRRRKKAERRLKENQAD